MNIEMSENWLIKKLDISENHTDDMKSLNLPGTYHEKISEIGTSLQRFIYLQHLDLSKNNISSLKGLEHLKLLETLNLYYNKVSDLKEVFRIRNCKNLLDVDLRLNPVTGNEPDYRLFIAHMLPQLQRLDDRPLRDSERKAAILHFSSMEAADDLLVKEIVKEREIKDTNEIKSRQPRVTQVKNFVRKPTFVSSDDTVTDIIEEVEKTTKTSNEKPPRNSWKPHSKQELYEILRNEQGKRQKETEPSSQNPVPSGLTTIKKNFDKNQLKFSDEDSAYHQYQTTAHYTPHPGTKDPPPTVYLKSNGSCNRKLNKDEDEFKRLPETKHVEFGESTSNQEQHRCKNLTQIRFVESLLDLVDRYWNGSKSLHHHHKFHALVQGPLDQFEADMMSSREVHLKVLQDKVTSQQKEIDNFHQKLAEVTTECEKPSKSHIKELETLKTRLSATASDNKILRAKISKLERKVQSSLEENSCEDDKLKDLELQKKELVQQVASLKISLEQQTRNNQLTSMLQDSHKSLVASNDHLLAELEDLKTRHQGEIDQLKWTYDQLRSTSKLANGNLYSDNEF